MNRYKHTLCFLTITAVELAFLPWVNPEFIWVYLPVIAILNPTLIIIAELTRADS